MNNFFSDDNFVDQMKAHVRENIELLLEKGIFFSILVNILEVEFDPKLPENISSTFKPITLFALAGYSYESIVVQEDYLEFEAGFGNENFGSIVRLPYSCIIQMLIDDTPIFINLSRKINKVKQDNLIERSKNIFLSNPENQKFK